MDYSGQIFDRLDKWRHFPAYQMERRADIFFAVFLPKVIESKFHSSVQTVIPEFPIWVGIIENDRPIRQSYKADYLVITENPKRCFLIELKTDDTSRRQEQDDYLIASQEVKLRALIDGVITIYQGKYSSHKYEALLNELEASELIERTASEIINQVSEDTEIDIVYIQPNADAEESHSISFAEFAQIIDRGNDEFARRFAKSLIEWANVEPGKR